MLGVILKSFILFLTLLFSLSAQTIEIENFKSGLMCGINKDDMGWVCFEQEEIKITGQSSCVSNNEEFKCTWYGYSFNYKSAKPNQKIDCKFWESNPITSINLDGVVKESSKYFEFSFNLDKTEGYFINPQYSALTTSSNDKIDKTIQKAICFSEGVEIYSYQFISVYSAN